MTHEYEFLENFFFKEDPRDYLRRELNTEKWFHKFYREAKQKFSTTFQICQQTIKEYGPLVLIGVGVTLMSYAIGYFGTLAIDKLTGGKISGRPRKRGNTQSGEFQKNYKPARIHRKFGKQKLTTQGYDEQNVAVENIMRNNFVRMSLYVVRDGQNICNPQVANCVAVAGNVFMTPKHYYLRFVQILKNIDYDEAYFEFLMPNTTTIKCQVDTIEWFLGSNDVTFFQVPKMSSFKDTSRFFVCDNDEINLSGCYLYGIRASSINGKLDLRPTILPVLNTDMETVAYDSGSAVDLDGNELDNLEFEGIDHYVYSGNVTIKGDCGMLLMTTSAISGCRKILGMHVAGSSNTNEGVACPVFFEDVEKAIKYFNQHHERIIVTQCGELIDESRVDLNEIERSVADGCGLAIEGKLKDVCIEGKTYKGYVPLARKSGIKKSVVYEFMEQDFQEAITKPAHLRPFTSDGERIQPISLALKKYQTHVRLLEEDIHKEVVNSCVDSFDSWISYPKERRVVWSDELALNGSGNVKPIDTSTSSGYPYVLANANGKKYWLPIVNSKLTMSKFVADNVTDRIAQAVKGCIKQTIFCDTLKDETRPIEKVDLGKTRIFQISPLDLTVVMRKYFGAFIDFIHGSYMHGECAIGIDPNSVDWGIRLQRLIRNGSRGWAGDFANYDSTIWQQLATWICEIINEWYSGSEEENLIRLVLMRTLFHSYHAILEFVFVIFGGNPSGNVLTTIINCIAFMILMRIFYLKHVGHDLSYFSKYLQLWIYGDDNLVLFRRSLQFGMRDATMFFRYYGMEYTDAQKSNEIQGQLGINEMTFLKRSFVKCDGEVWAPLPLKNLLEIPRWSESDPSNMVDQMQRFNACLLEASNYNREIFTRIRQCFVNYVNKLQALGYSIKAKDLFTWLRCYDIKRPGINKLNSHRSVDLDLHELGSEVWLNSVAGQLVRH
jgi:hypothetical protein